MDNILSHTELFYRYWNSHQEFQGARRPQIVRTTRLMYEIPEKHSVMSPPTNQRIVHKLTIHPVIHSSTPNVTFKNLLQAIQEFRFSEHELPVLLAWCVCNKHCTFLHCNPVSVDWLCCATEERTHVWFSNNLIHIPISWDGPQAPSLLRPAFHA